MSLLKKVMTGTALVAGGMALGAGLGMLLAPHSGRVTRGQIQVQAHKAQDHMNYMGGRVIEKVDNVLEKGKQVFGNHKGV